MTIPKRKALLSVGERWKRGVHHDHRSIAVYKSIAKIDFEQCSDSFCFKDGGDGDNGETLMYLLDVHFQQIDGAKDADLDVLRHARATPRDMRDALRSDANLAWAVLGPPTVRVAGPWHRTNTSKWVRDTMSGGVIGAYGSTHWHMARADAKARIDGWLLVGGLPDGADPEHGATMRGDGVEFICRERVGHQWACRGEGDGRIVSAHNAPVRWEKSE